MPLSSAMCLFLPIHAAGLIESLWFHSILAISCNDFSHSNEKNLFWLLPLLSLLVFFWVMFIAFLISLSHIFASCMSIHNAEVWQFIFSFHLFHIGSVSISQAVWSVSSFLPNNRAQVILDALSRSQDHEVSVHPDGTIFHFSTDNPGHSGPSHVPVFVNELLADTLSIFFFSCLLLAYAMRVAAHILP